MISAMNKASLGWMYYAILLTGWLAGMGLCEENATPESPKTDIWEDHLVHPFDADRKSVV